MSEMTLDYIDDVHQFMYKLALDYIDFVCLLYVWDDIELKNQVKHLSLSHNEHPDAWGKAHITRRGKSATSPQSL